MRVRSLCYIRQQKIAPLHVALAEQMQTVVGPPWVEVVIFVSENRAGVDPCESFVVGHGTDARVYVANDLFFAEDSFVAFERIVDREQRLDIELCLWRFCSDVVDQLSDCSGDRVGGQIVGNVVDADKEENFCGMSVDDRIDSLHDSFDYVTVDSTVFDVWHSEQFVPLAAVCQAVADEHNVGRVNGQQVEQ